MKIGMASGDWSRTATDDNGHPVWGGSGWVRLGQYQHLLNYPTVAGILCAKDGIFGVKDWDGNVHLDCDIIIMQRIMFRDVADKLPEALASGQIVINDLDDWYWGLSPANHAWLSSHPSTNAEENREHYRRVLARSSALMVSTEYLASRLTWIEAPITVLKNTVDINRFHSRVHEDEVPIVGWVGSTSHRSGDIEQIAGVLRPLLNEGAIRLHHSGHSEGATFFADMIGVDREAVTTLPLVPPSKYPDSFVFDIGVVPLTDTPFNHAKSWIKGIEYAAAGVPFVASKLPEYQKLRDQYGVGHVAKNGVQWRKAIERLCDPDVRSLVAKEARDALQPLDISAGAERINSFIESLI